MIQISIERRHLLVGLFLVAIALLLVPGVSMASSRFSDVDDSNVFHDDIAWMADVGVTRGCGGDKFCPKANVTREQMAAFMHRFAGVVGDGGGSAGTDPTVLSRLSALESNVETLTAENTDLKATLAGVTRDGDTMLFSGMNVQVVNGEGSTDTTNALGNLIIGYNHDDGADVRTGSHVLVVGDEHTYVGYGGVVAGRNNVLDGGFLSVTGGRDNTASGFYTSVSGGRWNAASTAYTSVTGGHQNSATAWFAAVSGGSSNVASADYASVAGGSVNTASGWYSAVYGGWENVASGHDSVILGGRANTAIGTLSAISGGADNTVSGTYSAVSGGRLNAASGDYSSVSGGLSNSAVGQQSSILGGETNTATSDVSSIGGGDDITCLFEDLTGVFCAEASLIVNQTIWPLD